MRKANHRNVCVVAFGREARARRGVSGCFKFGWSHFWHRSGQGHHETDTTKQSESRHMKPGYGGGLFIFRRRHAQSSPFLFSFHARSEPRLTITLRLSAN